MVRRADRLSGERALTPLRVLAAVGGVLVVLFLAGLLPVEAVRVEADSMVPTVQPGDRLLITHSTSELGRGELVVLGDPLGSGLLVKRVAALGGDVFAIEDGVVVVNGAAVVEPWSDQSRLDGVYHRPVTVPPGYVFVLGDNRGDSVDSREFGPVRQGSVVGRVAFRLWPSPGNLEQPVSASSGRFPVMVTTLFDV